jgi:hypothetical protein
LKVEALGGLRLVARREARCGTDQNHATQQAQLRIVLLDLTQRYWRSRGTFISCPSKAARSARIKLQDVRDSTNSVAIAYGTS